jgi:hypothetical protein
LIFRRYTPLVEGLSGRGSGRDRGASLFGDGATIAKKIKEQSKPRSARLGGSLNKFVRRSPATRASPTDVVVKEEEIARS